MVDIHHHLLPGLDDGSPDLETSVAMTRMAAEDGITHIVCTPHASGHYTFQPELVAAKLQELRDAVRAENIPVTIGQGCDFHINYENVEDALANPRKYTINGHHYLMVELPDLMLPPSLDETFYRLKLAGMTPVLTHPERNPVLQKDTSKLKEWMRHGLLLQVTTSSVLGRMGKTAHRVAHEMLDNQWVHFLATDAHNLKSRPPRMREACDAVAEKYGREYADLLCTENPMAVFEGQPLGDQFTPLNLDDEEHTGNKAPWWKRLFGA